MLNYVFASMMVLLFYVPAAAETVFIETGRDTTLIQDPFGANANGSGPVFFAGRTNQPENSIRRGLLYFDIARSLPPSAIIESVSLVLYESQGNPGMSSVSLHRVLDRWGEGASVSSGGSGAPSRPDDATWIHTIYPGTFWVHEGGHFVARVSAMQAMDDTGYYTWQSTSHLVNDVRLWLHAPEQNHGWIVIGDESTPQNVKRFASRENANPRLRPMLEVAYRFPAGKGDDESLPEE